MECLKDCCKNFMNKKGRDQDTQGEVELCTAAYHTALTECVVSDCVYFLCSQVITLKMPPTSGRALDDDRRGVTEDYLLSKLPPDGREVPFVLPTFKASFIQPSGSRFPNLQSGPQSMYLLKNYVSKEHTQLTSVTHASLPQYRVRWSQRLRGLTHITPPKQAQHSLRSHRANGRLSLIKISSEITLVWRDIWLHRRQVPGYPVSEWIAWVSQFTDWKGWFGQMKACWPAALFLCLQVQRGPRTQRGRQSCWAAVSSPTAPSPDCTRAGWLSSSPLDRPAATHWRTETPPQVAAGAGYMFIHASLILFWNQKIICECLTIRNQ